ncbi:saccharopine dehydrogenase, putative [Coccidioides posadasii C735 delta SOWgp]|uniref:Saccharopine dehydrogenase, putative n=1 Tax=Coccidioides posadasii (strain C735) TaxID=222929 RepID=C5PDN9_COCP7|nr:saccharopine dehydrogenase, putative [Coccidioides posadasii C735 delta SOWgp]EER25200.1 saccharopine dehydrogenase, putative [Coccidioides posadasii C735 delta SOWgp]|eukprot:XP_003067345.1 saccharopine dehydrogenase, putative [Coccidioides posadasii C735 delta SOWgp]
MASSRSLDIIVLGATGYTGKCCAEHIAQNLPTTLKWGIAGRSAQKLEALASELKRDGPDRKDPEILPVQLNDDELGSLVRKTKVLINCVGPYHKYSTPVVKACANNGTHYLDVTGEIPWVQEMIDKYDETAKRTGAIMIPTDGFESAPSDLVTWSMAKSINAQFGVKVKEVILSLYELKGAGISGGTAASILAAFENLTFKDFRAMNDPYRLSVSRPSTVPSTPLLRRLFGVHYVRDIGTVTTTLPASCDSAIVHRSSSLMPDLYDQNFHFQEFGKARNVFMGLVVHFCIILAAICLMIPPIRLLVKRFLPDPGQGPAKEDTVGDYVEYRGVATAEHAEPGKKPIRVLGRLAYQGPAYPMTGMLIAEAAMVLITSERVGKDLKGGYLTPAILGDEYVARLEKCGVSIETKVLED